MSNFAFTYHRVYKISYVQQISRCSTKHSTNNFYTNDVNCIENKSQQITHCLARLGSAATGY